MKWARLLTEERPGGVEYEAVGQDLRSGFEKDYHRIIVSASFRRLQDKTQVFPLDKSDFIRTRLTHSLEVSSIARSLGQNIGSGMLEAGLDPEFSAKHKADMGDVLQCAGLIHDIGNPPFGHFGEETIREWFRLKLPGLMWKGKPAVSYLGEVQRADLESFEGNAQGLRMVSRLDYPVHRDGLNLTYAVLGCMIKYPVSSVEADPSASLVWRRKFGYFSSEADLFTAIQARTGTDGRRNPLAYILEAADDIAYATADIEDAFIKGFFGFNTFLREMKQRGVSKAHCTRLTDLFDMAMITGAVDPEESAVRSWLREAQNALIVGASNAFLGNYSAIMDGRYGKELLGSRQEGKLLSALKSIAYDYAFTSTSIFRTEISANRILNYLLDILVPASLLLDEEGQGLMEEKYLSLIPGNYRMVCRKASEGGSDADKICARLRMAVDTVSGMTDSYARDLYSELTGLI